MTAAFHLVAAGLSQGFYMFWDTLWAMVLGFGLSGAVQAFISRGQMERLLGDHRPRTIAKAGLLGAISSSCSYAASALAKSLFARGADFTAAMVFMMASTNLVVELGLVLWLLIGWQFALAELVGGTLMIAMLALILPRVLPGRWLADARDHLNLDRTEDLAPTAVGDHQSWAARMRSAGGWADAAGYAISDLTMLRKELFAGFLIAGFAASAVPLWFWRSLFLSGHGIWSSLENAAVGPFLAMISFVCSVGNVPLAAALWHGGISFGGVIAFVFADLITLPLLLIYRKYYGGGITLRLLGVFWVVMSTTGLVSEYLFRAAGIAPNLRPSTITFARIGLNFTSGLDILALVVFVSEYWLYRNRVRLGGGTGYAKDLVCGMQVDRKTAPARASYKGGVFFFCSDRCRKRFQENPDRFVSSSQASRDPGDSALAAVDPVCGMAVDPKTAAAVTAHEGRLRYFCNPGCRDAFLADPAAYSTDA
ncbi:MAG: permease [Mycobacteriales bacterium]